MRINTYLRGCAVRALNDTVQDSKTADVAFLFPHHYSFSWVHGHRYKDYISQHLLWLSVATRLCSTIGMLVGMVSVTLLLGCTPSSISNLLRGT